MQPHPDFAQTSWPRAFTLGPFQLTPLSVAVVEEDYAAVMGAAPLLRAELPGPWPEGLTLEDNRIDLAWHEREFTARRSFAWVLRAMTPERAGPYLGCVYVYPEIGARGKAQVVFWLCAQPDRNAVAQRLKALLGEWLAGALPRPIALTWTTAPNVPA